ncbi:MAG TPA: hypothetical protein VN663_16155 [Ramlibacter sp.]|nr:hypothetical protein [Ramlibacter sp.]
MKTAPAFWRAAALLAVIPAAWACGVCIEDKVAATYDHEVVVRAAAKGKLMVFCEIAGPLDARRIRSAAHSVRGVDPASLRISSQPAALSFALEARQSPQAAVSDIQRGIPAGTHVAIVGVIAPGGALAKAPQR